MQGGMVSHLGSELFDGGGDFGEAELVGVAHDGDHEAAWGLHRHAHVNVVVHTDEVRVPGCIHLWDGPQRLHSR